MKRKKPSLRLLFISDDIREEVDNKISIIGLSVNNEVVLKIPGILVKICFQVFIDNVQNNDTFKMVLIDPDGKVVLTFEPPPIEFLPPKKINNCILNLIATGIKIDKSGDYIFKIFFPNDNDDKNIIDKKKIIFRKSE